MSINEKYCSQANAEDDAPPASEDKNRLKVKIRQPNNQLINCKYKYKNKTNFIIWCSVTKVFSGVTIFHCWHVSWPQLCISSAEAGPSARGELSVFTQQHHEEHHLPTYDPHVGPSWRWWALHQCHGPLMPLKLFLYQEPGLSHSKMAKQSVICKLTQNLVQTDLSNR